MPSTLRAIFFDAGNTLVYACLDGVTEDLTRHGYPATAEDFFAAERAGKQKLDEWLWPQIRQGEVPRTIDPYYWGVYLGALVERLSVPEAERPRVMQLVANHFSDIRLWSRVLPETAPFLEKLRGQGYYLGVISNSLGTLEGQLQHLDLARYFETIIDSTIVGVEKPHPDIFRIGLQRAGVSPAEALFVGDTNATDMGGARLAGLRGVLMDPVGAYPNAESPRITSLPELEQFL
jgi:HAD superfamily hydrolase (TIGR01509 family)